MVYIVKSSEGPRLDDVNRHHPAWRAVAWLICRQIFIYRANHASKKAFLRCEGYTFTRMMACTLSISFGGRLCVYALLHGLLYLYASIADPANAKAREFRIACRVILSII